MTKIVMTKRGASVLIAADEEARCVMDHIKDGTDLMVEIKRARNPRQHRLFFALLNLLVQNSDAFDNVEQALSAVKIGIGEVDPMIDARSGKTFWTLRSIAFESCEQDRFNRIFERSLSLICDRWLIGTDRDDLRREVMDMTDSPERRSLGRRVA